ncbi:MAG TPA: secondary thiamine-phosphate synthase enzyme YjbQ [Candidatus Hydrogenedentes bacterium]|nr:secondary thiamine-phosphate synthase enzyme YjbQ [Candidatus Hydrogenedentota bacterium]HPU99228.1 secondary thiamine-phosphate synthase enzyme YjbQ [Candidatus Hydrogenedentota bacterium]
MVTLDVRTQRRDQFIKLDSLLESACLAQQWNNGLLFVFVPHTTAGITINENADPDVPADILQVLDRLIPWTGPYAHAEGNTAAHVKACLMGSSVTVPVASGKLRLGTWQSVFFCEFDGPRNRKVILRFLATAD